MKEKFYYKIWSIKDDRFIKSPTKTNFLYQSEKVCQSVIDNEIRTYSISRSNYMIKKFKLVEVTE